MKSYECHFFADWISHSTDDLICLSFSIRTIRFTQFALNGSDKGRNSVPPIFLGPTRVSSELWRGGDRAFFGKISFSTCVSSYALRSIETKKLVNRNWLANVSKGLSNKNREGREIISRNIGERENKITTTSQVWLNHRTNFSNVLK